VDCRGGEGGGGEVCTDHTVVDMSALEFLQARFSSCVYSVHTLVPAGKWKGGWGEGWCVFAECLIAKVNMLWYAVFFCGNTFLLAARAR